MFAGFEIDELFFYYPAYSEVPDNYNPLQEDWYHLAKLNSPNTTFIEGT
jgi:hypothetical protein